jgi:hypothetical protein
MLFGNLSGKEKDSCLLEFCYNIFTVFSLHSEHMSIQVSEFKIIGGRVYWYLNIMEAVMKFVTPKLGLVNFEQLNVNNFLLVSMSWSLISRRLLWVTDMTIAFLFHLRCCIHIEI